MLVVENKKRKYLKDDFKPDVWDSIKPIFEELASRPIADVSQLKRWFLDRSELESALSEELGWRYIRMTCDTQNQRLTDDFNYFVSEIQPNIAPYQDQLNQKALHDPHFSALQAEQGFDIIFRLLEKDARLFREKNIPLQAEVSQEEQRFAAISGKMTIEVEGKEITLPQASDHLESWDRARREQVWLKIQQRRYQDKDELDELFDSLLKKRDQIAKNADQPNFRDHMFIALGRFSYSVEDCFSFHRAIQEVVSPIIKDLALERQKKLGVDVLRPWDLAVNYHDKSPLKPYKNADDLLEKTIRCFDKIDPFIGECLVKMKEMGHLDLASRKGKAPGGYNYPLEETGVPFIFMNATSSLRDLTTMVHEGGHALHSFLTRDLEMNYFRNPPSEIAELASMAMELISMEHWEIFFPDKKDLARAKKEQLEGIIATLPWVATIDKFQHWIYENPQHDASDRVKAWTGIFSEFSDQVTDWSGFENYRSYAWHKQLHIYEVPFYYIEYGIAQLGAIGVWKNYKEDPGVGLKKYLEALKLGYTRPINEVYEVAGVRFDLSATYIKELMDFVRSEYEKSEL